MTKNQSISFKISAVGIFIIFAFTFIFPSNFITPFDRKTIAVIGGLSCYIASLVFKNDLDILESIDFDVLVLLVSIMMINHVLVHLEEVQIVIKAIQMQIINFPVRGFWILSFVAFITSPFLTNDGVCLLFVEIVVNVFQKVDSFEYEPNQVPRKRLQKRDAIYFLIVLSCSSNIGSALTYTGNPQNMIVGQDAMSVLSPIAFLGYMIIPSTISWLLTTAWIQRCWLSHESGKENDIVSIIPLPEEILAKVQLQTIPTDDVNYISRGHKIINSPFPAMVFILVMSMICMIFVNIIPIAGLVTICSITIIVALILGAHWRKYNVWENKSESQDKPTTDNSSNRIIAINSFCDSMFDSIDFHLLLIFLGTFIVVANIDSTGIPRIIWSKIAGKVAFRNAASIAGISLFILISSQLLGNVAVVQLAKPNVHDLADHQKKIAWAIISFVSTVGGNLTITGSAANIIVAEKANRMDKSTSLNFNSHFRICFGVTVLSCTTGALIISAISIFDK